MPFSPAFEQALRITLGEEGGWSNVAGDRGGPTMAGITQATYDEYRRLRGLPARSVAESTPEERKDAYFELFWNRGRCSSLGAPASLVHFDSCVNHGPGTAVRLVQAIVGARPIDGGFGPRTTAAVAHFAARDLARKIITARRGFYVGLLVTNPGDSDSKFINGWLARMDHIEPMLA